MGKATKKPRRLPSEQYPPRVRRTSGNGQSQRGLHPMGERIDKSELARPEPRRIRDLEHVRFVAKQPCLVCGRLPSDPHHLRFTQHPALGRKVSDEFIVPLCRGHHREAHRCGDEAAWWQAAGVDPTTSARLLWLTTHPQSWLRKFGQRDRWSFCLMTGTLCPSNQERS